MINKDRGDWMQTFTGRAFYPLAPEVQDIDSRDIAHALSLLCRYGGHVGRFYSVAEHCILISEAVAPADALWALLHDATEAYLGDMIRPIKRAMPTYRAVEDHLMEIICKRYGITPGPMPPGVKDADNRILLDERSVLLGIPPQTWGSVENLESLGVTIHAWSPKQAEARYLKHLKELT